MNVGGDSHLWDLLQSLEDYHHFQLVPIHHHCWDRREPVLLLPAGLDRDSFLTLGI